MTGGGRSKVVEPQLRVLSLRMVRAAATRQSLEAAVAVARTAVAAAATTSAEVGSLPGGWGMGKPMGGESRGRLRGVPVLLLLPTPFASCRCFMRTLEFR